MYKLLQILILTLVIPTIFFCQSIQIKHVYKIPEESFKKYEPESFLIDSMGNFCYEVEIDSFWYYFTNLGLIGKSDYIGGTKGSSGSISYTINDNFYNKPDTFWYRNNYETKIYGPEYGILEEFITSPYGNGVAAIISRNDSVFYIVNGETKYSTVNSEDDVSTDDWCVFNKLGDYLFKVDCGDYNKLFLNNNIVDSARAFNYISLDDEKNYRYVRFNLGNKPDDIICNGEIIYSGNGYIRGYSNTQGETVFYAEYGNIKLIFNDTLFIIPHCPRFSNDLSRLKIYIKFSSFINVCNSDRKLFNVNCNNLVSQNFNDIYDEVCDSTGKFSFFGLIDYYLYSVTNGVITDTLTKEGVRGKPVYISPNGKHIVYYNIGDSVYFYRDKDLLKIISKNKIFNFRELYYGLRFYNEKDEQQRDAKYLTIDNESYVLIGENVYGPYLRFTESWKKQGYIELGGISENNEFYFLQVIDERSCKLILNGIDYGEFEYDAILENSINFNGSELSFYIISLGNVYQINTIYGK